MDVVCEHSVITKCQLSRSVYFVSAMFELLNGNAGCKSG